MSRELPILNKPLEGAECNQCGYCCTMEACLISETVFGDERTPCTALEKVGNKFYCGLVRSPEKYIPRNSEETNRKFSDWVSGLLGIGKGCCSSDK